jgi:hypothetical protein
MYVVICKDKQNAQNLRQSLRQEHLDFIQKNNHIVKIAGPILAEDSQSMAGSILIVDLTTKAEVESFLNKDPYSTGELFESTEILHYKLIINNL